MNVQSMPVIETQRSGDSDVARKGVSSSDSKVYSGQRRGKIPGDSEKQLPSLLEKAEKVANIFGRNLKFRYREEADVYQVEVVDAESNEVVRKIPPDEMVRFIENIQELFGALFDARA